MEGAAGSQSSPRRGPRMSEPQASLALPGAAWPAHAAVAEERGEKDRSPKVIRFLASCAGLDINPPGLVRPLCSIIASRPLLRRQFGV